MAPKVNYAETSGSLVVVTVQDPDRIDSRALRRLGGHRVPFVGRHWVFRTWKIGTWYCDTKLAAVLTGLRDLGVAFAPDYKVPSAAEDFERLRDRGLVTGPYRRVNWMAPDGPPTVVPDQ